MPGASPAGALRRLAGVGLDLLLPLSCLACDETVTFEGALCVACFTRLEWVGEPLCVCCGVPFVAGEARLCTDCTDSPPMFERARAALRYTKESRPILLAFKNSDRTELARGLAVHMARAGGALLASAEVLVPVPLHRSRLFARRYNQAALLARALSRLSGVPSLPDALQRGRATEKLGHHGAAARARIITQGAIAVRPRHRERLAGRRVLLIDDVLTTGATAQACAAALHEADVAAVDVLAAARVPGADSR